MTTALGASVDLLEQALAYTGARLGDVRDDLLDRPTPCADWRLEDLLAHMEDALDAFTEAAVGAVPVHASLARASRIEVIRLKACGLLGAWGRPAPGDVLVGGLDLPTPMLLATAALEVTVHGWDVGQAVGTRVPLPAGLAAELLPVAWDVVTAADRGVRFGEPCPTSPHAPDGDRLLAHVGRST